jgi:hypothetical protein
MLLLEETALQALLATRFVAAAGAAAANGAQALLQAAAALEAPHLAD